MYSSCTFIGISFFKLGNYSLILFKIFSGYLRMVSFFPLVLIFLDLFFPRCHWMSLCQEFVRFSIFSYQCVHLLSYHQILIFTLLSLIFCWWSLALYFQKFRNFSLPEFPQFQLSFLFIFPFKSLEQYCFLLLFLFFLDFL